MSSLDYSEPPHYDVAVPSPDYSRNPDPSESLVESSLSPPPYLTRTHSNSSRASGSNFYGIDIADEYRALETIYGSTRSLPEVPPAIVDTSRTSYVFTSGNIELDLGVRPEENRTIPSYGKNGIIKGLIKVKKMSHVQAVTVSLEGRAQTMVMQGGLASGHSAIKLLDISKTIYTAPEDERLKGKGKEPTCRFLPFEFEFPSTIPGSKDPLPPTFRGVHPAMEGWVRYTLKIQMIKTGFWPRETLLVAVHYLPKFYVQPEALLWPVISIMDGKRFGFECNKWKTSKARLLSSAPEFAPGREPELSLSIPKTAQAVANFCFIANVTLRVPGATAAQLNDYVDRTTVQLIKVVTMSANGSKSAHYVGLAKSRVQQIEKELVDPDTRIIRGGFKGGAHEGEASWNVGQLINVEYFVRVTVSTEDKKLLFRHDEPIEMFTHSRDQYECPFEIHDAPAYNILLGSSLSGNTPSLP